MFHPRQKISIASSLALALLAFVAPGVRAEIISPSITVDGFNGDSHVNLSNCHGTNLSFSHADVDGAKVSLGGSTINIGGLNVPAHISGLKFGANGNEIGSGKLTVGFGNDKAVFSITNAHLSLKYGHDDDDKIKGVLTGTLTLLHNTIPGINFASSVGTFTDTMNLHGDPHGNGNFQANFPVPEPASLTLWGAVGLVGAWYGRRKMQRTVAV